MSENLLYSKEAVRNACHGFIGSPLKDERKTVIGKGVRTRIENKVLMVTYRLNRIGRQQLSCREVEIGVMRVGD